MPEINAAKAPTVKAVCVYAAKLRAQGDQEVARDVYASPYRPTEAAARKLSSRLGPSKAIEYMRTRAAMHARDAREASLDAQRTLARDQRRQARFRADRERQRSNIRPGRRIDDAINRLRVVASPASSTLAEQINGGEPNQVPAFAVDAAGKAVAIAYAAAASIEALEDAVKARDLSKAA